MRDFFCTVVTVPQRNNASFASSRYSVRNWRNQGPHAGTHQCPHHLPATVPSTGIIAYRRLTFVGSLDVAGIKGAPAARSSRANDPQTPDTMPSTKITTMTT
mmetsp:Transcript_10502/g.29144  ORF Transcript_10502/g.29144 Transcript_10502/m.29144 type:complete len:102 (-) Transcript_10502:71-376(-)